ncbi:NAD-dependent epimerase/dehydratase family protein [Arthrobacter agilis]|uniref:NAD-dependent epimerase/dehydratase family protein n=1 Tax=Arthrobacter agilis TaxID=37921 RepID=UPI002365F734|nr:NAD-dependent epimerase/dehydratase family protein [Arthrobacter agilis]WDF32810.1 NAD-dependent epimerase/dehydratase family protein [Arthrobacter agilis]
MRRVLILGGTAWLGRELARVLVRDGDHVTCLARGIAGPPAEGAVLVAVDRALPGAYAAVRGEEWDEVIELSWNVQHVTDALAALAPGAAHWTLISSCSVYASDAEVDQTEAAALMEPGPDPDIEDYAVAKVLCERLSAAALGGRLLTVRAGLIVGPGDPSDRFGYWVSRFGLAGDGAVLTPTLAGRHVQVIDVRDLAAWTVGAGRRGTTGVVNAVGEIHAFGEVMAQARSIAGHTGPVLEAVPEWLVEQGVAYWAGPRSLPLWLPESFGGFFRRSNARLLAAGGELRDIRGTLEDTLDDERARGLGRDRRSGLTRPDEAELLTALVSTG